MTQTADDTHDRRFLSRRTVMLGAGVGALGSALGALEVLGGLAHVPQRAAQAAEAPSDVQFDLSAFTPAATTLDGVAVRFPPVHTVFATARLSRTPTRDDQVALGAALGSIESAYPWSPGGLFTEVAYGLPYFNRLDAGLVGRYVPRLRGRTRRSVLEEAVAGPTDVGTANPGVTKQLFNVPVRIERNDLLFTFRSDVAGNIADVLAWLGGSGRLRGRRVASPRLGAGLTFTSSRAMFIQLGLPRRLAQQSGLPYAGRINPASSMWMGFVDQQVGANPAAPTVTFAGAQGQPLTSARGGDYFDNGAVQHLAHDILDLAQFYADDEPFTERVQYMFRSNPIPSEGNTDQFTDGGGGAVFPATFQGNDDALHNAEALDTFQGEHRLGHLSCLHRSSRTPDGVPLHLRADGPGLDSMDVPDGTRQPKLQFSIYVPTADLFARMRVDQASLDLQNRFAVDPDDNGLERFITATRRQNFLVPPRRHRSFPLVEL
ncbi:MAG TPA: hypothetical protein VJT31_14875 [Rugosimonospora sp.]|nr:hypothetical protein [Rugosimonospora sp.]